MGLLGLSRSKIRACTIMTMSMGFLIYLISFYLIIGRSYQLSHLSLKLSVAMMGIYQFDHSLFTVVLTNFSFWLVAMMVLTSFLVLISTLSQNNIQALFISLLLLIALPLTLAAVDLRPMIFPTNIMGSFDRIYHLDLSEQLAGQGYLLHMIKMSGIPLLVIFVNSLLSRRAFLKWEI